MKTNTVPAAAESNALRTWSLRDVGKTFPGVRALDGVDLELRPGSIHALVGENGCGKSTLIKVLAGVHQPDQGSVLLDGEPITFGTPRQARSGGVATIHQEFSLVPQMSVLENVVLGSYPVGRNHLIDRKAVRRRAEEALALLQIPLDLRAAVSGLSVADQQVVEIAKAVSVQSSLLILDEPTTALSVSEVERLHGLIRRLADAGKCILYVSHRLEELFDVADETTVLRDGKVAARFPDPGPDVDRVVEAMVGRSVNQFYAKDGHARPEVALGVTDLASDKGVRSVSFEVRRGEVLGLAGVVGSGRTEIARALFGVDRPSAGEVELEGARLGRVTPAQAIARGIGYVPESRKFEGLFFNLTASQNMSVARMGRVAKGPFLDTTEERRAGRGLIADFAISSHADQVQIGQLSGGNQQKIVLARWVFAQSRVLILDEPTQGIDVGAKQEVYRIIDELTADGVAVLLISSDLPELLALSDRLAVVRHGTVTQVVGTADLTELELVELISGTNTRD